MDDGISQAEQNQTETEGPFCLCNGCTCDDRTCRQIVISDGKQGRLLWRESKESTSASACC